MSITYNAEEIYDIGIQIETNGWAFYQAAAESAEEEDVKKLLTDLAHWEKAHIDLFKELKKQIPSDLQTDPSLDLDQQQLLYLKAAADTHIFTKNADPVALAKTCKGPMDVLRVAMDFEKDSVVLYAAMKDLVPESLGKDNIDKLIQEEISHISMIHDWMERLGGN
ncbi:MAG: ferritin family protein [Deltaproteobacteria bacterium]|nr:ferritin family protein [Deltaproteobacteria bacterium]